MDDARNVCEGCWRTLAEIAEWGRASEARRGEILGAVAARRETDAARNADESDA
jgi:predicted Fe-S protein YdhL (DUF1289 family)